MLDFPFVPRNLILNSAQTGGEFDRNGAENLGNLIGGNVAPNVTSSHVFYEEAGMDELNLVQPILLASMQRQSTGRPPPACNASMNSMSWDVSGPCLGITPTVPLTRLKVKLLRPRVLTRKTHWRSALFPGVDLFGYPIAARAGRGTGNPSAGL